MDKATAWMCLYSGIVALQFHPGTKERISPEELALRCDAYLKEALCRGLLVD